jgi:hypothetical protein
MGEGPVELRSTRQAEAWRAGRKPRPTKNPAVFAPLYGSPAGA